MKIFVTRSIPKPGLELLQKNYDIEVNPFDRVLTKQEIISGIQGKDGLLCLLTDTIDSEVILSEPKLKMIANYAVGYNNIDVKTATKKGIPISNTPGVLTDTTAEMAWALLFSVARRIVEGDECTRTGKFKGWSPLLMLGQDVTHKTLGVLGAGRIGTAFALKSKGFNMKVLYTDMQQNQILERKVDATRVPLSALLQQADYVSIHVPLISSTHHLIGENELKLMKKTAILINTSRGPVIDEIALIQALENKWIFGVGLDVYEHEPTIPQALRKLKNVILQPHSASATYETRTKMALVAAENMIAGLNGKVPKNCINPKVFSQ
jgi:lactate dehydrogenase-like 2-hydroxyacid dehydrogenase